MEEVKEFPFVGRVGELGHCRRLLRKAPAAESGVSIVVTGGRGVGKTRLIEEMLEQARGLGYRVLFHRCQESDRYRPFGTISALVGLMLGKPPGWTPRSLETVGKTVSELYPELLLDELELQAVGWLLGASGVGQGIEDIDERSRKGLMGALFGKLLVHQIRRRPLLLLAVDDLHYSDSFSSGYLSTAPLGSGMVLLASAPSLKAVEFRREGEEIGLAPFDEEEVKLLLGRRFGRNFPSEQLAPALVKVTEGNALYLVQFLVAIPTDGTAASKLSGILEETCVIRTFEIVLTRLRKLSARTLKLVKVASVMENRFPLAILRQLLGSKFHVKPSLRQLHRLKLAWVEGRKGPRFFRFQHGIVREAAYSLLEVSQKKQLHAACAKVLERYYRRHLDRHLMVIARHYEEAADAQNAAEAYLEAGDYLFKTGELPSAEEAYRAAARLFTDKEKELDALAKHIGVLDAECKVEPCIEAAGKFLRMSPPDKLKAAVLASLARLHIVSGSLHKSVEYAQKAMEVAATCGADREVAKASAMIAIALARMGRIKDALSYGAKGYGIAERLQDKRLLGSTLNALAITNAIDGNTAQARQLFERSAQMFKKAGYLFSAAQMMANVATAINEMGEFDEAVKRYMEAVKLFEKMGALESTAIARYNAAIALGGMGEYQKGLSLLESARSLYQTIGSAAGVGQVLVLKAFFLLKVDKVGEATPELEKGWQILSREGRWKSKALVVKARIEAAILAGDMEKALQESESFLDEAGRSDVEGMYRKSLALRLRALLAADRVDEAQHVADRMQTAGFSEQNPNAEASYKAALAHLAAKRCDFGMAESLLEEALSTGRLDRDTCAECYSSLGEAMLKAGELKKARQYLALAKKEYSILVSAGYRTRELNRVRELLKGGVEDGPG